MKNRGLLLVYSRPKPHANMHRSSTCFVGYLFVVALNVEKDVYPVKITDHQQVIMDKHIRRKLSTVPAIPMRANASENLLSTQYGVSI